MVYFQSYTNTYGDFCTLREYYDTAFEFGDVVGISVGTRPDCAPEEVLDLLDSYARKGFEVWIELGLQSANFETLKKVNRAHGVSDFVDAVLRAKRRNLKVCAHVIIGFPWEDREDVLETARLVSVLPVDGVKIHPLHIIEGTKMASEYRREGFELLTLDQYASLCADFIEHIPERVVIQRITGEVDESRLIAPDYCKPSQKNRVISRVLEEFRRRGTHQGYNF
jgi:radical SAM protein (TIGR01212 family)